MNDNPVIDRAALERLREWGGDKLVSQMIRLYMENAEARLKQIDTGLSEGGEFVEAERGAHSLKSSAANVGARQVNEISQQMEDAAERGEVDAVRALRAGLAEALSRAQSELNQILENEEG